MEYGLGFDDSLFEKARDRSFARPVSYNAKDCPPQWFEGAETSDPADRMQVLKYHGDHSYHSGHYDKALKGYKEALVLLPKNNITMDRDIRESLARTHVKLGQLKEALSLAIQLHEGSLNFEHKTDTLHLLAKVYQARGDLLDELICIQKCICLHPMNADLWLRLAELYTRLATQNEIHENRETKTELLPQKDLLHSCHGTTVTSGIQRLPQEEEKKVSEDNSSEVTVRSCDKPTSQKSHRIPSENVSTLIQTKDLEMLNLDHDDHCSLKPESLVLCPTKIGGSSREGLDPGAEQLTAMFLKLKSKEIEKNCQVCTHMSPRLVVATCLLRTRLLLKAVEKVVLSFAKSRNLKMQEEVSGKLDLLEINPERFQKCKKFLRKDIFNLDSDGSSPERSLETNLTPEQIIEMGNAAFQEHFEKAWFIW